MKRKALLKLAEELSNARGVSGFEDEVLAVLRRHGGHLGELSEDSLRNLYLSRRENRGGRPMVQLDAHSDEVGFMVRAVRPNGTLAFTPLGGWVPCNIPAHRVLVQTADGVETRLVYVDRDLLLIPSVAIHMNRKANDGYSYDPKTDMVPLMGLGLEKGSFRAIVVQAAGCEAGDILGTDLFLCLRQKGLVWGAEDQFVSAPMLDDLQCAYGCFRGFMEAEEAASVPVFALLDNEEVGSLTKQGADGTFLADVAERICAAFGKNRAQAMAHSFMVSADNAHAVHPNHPEYADATHRPAMNGGPVIKHGVRYATDGASQAVFTALCRRADVPVQQFSNRSDMAGGSTLGNISNSHLSLNTVDIGLPQLAMHSCFETAGVKDTQYLIQVMTLFYGSVFREEAGRFFLGA